MLEKGLTLNISSILKPNISKFFVKRVQKWIQNCDFQINYTNFEFQAIYIYFF